MFDETALLALALQTRSLRTAHGAISHVQTARPSALGRWREYYADCATGRGTQGC